MKWLKENNCPWYTSICCFYSDTFGYAAKFGNLDNMKWLKENSCPWDGRTFKKAIEYGNLDNIKWLIENNCPLCKGNLITYGNLKQINNFLKDNLKDNNNIVLRYS